jgi:phage-related protein
MATPEEIALKAIDKQAKALHKIITFLQNTTKKLVGFISTLVNGLKALLSKLRQISQLIPSALLGAAKKAVQFLTKTLKDLPKRLKTIVRFMKNMVKAIKAGLSDTLVTMVSLAINMIKAMFMGLEQFFKNLLDVIKPLERLTSVIKQAEILIRAVVEDIADILKQMAAMVDIKSVVQAALKKLKQAVGYIGETEKNLVKLGRAMA